MSHRVDVPRRAPVARTLASLALLVAAGCAALEDLPDRLLDRRTPRERYEASLAASGLTGTALASDWLATANRALLEAPRITATHREEGYLLPAEPVAIAFRVPARRGQLLRLEFAMPGDSTTLVFLDAWQEVGDSLPEFRHVASADSGARWLEVEPRRDGDYILRVQPELLRGGRFAVSIRVAPSLAFPVSGRQESDVGSKFGVERDGGARQHHGIDIFAPRGTPVIAASAGVVRRVEETPRGGLVVWLTDDRQNRLYYAHLQSQAVTAGQRVEVGDTLGTVGNTGNAITTPPHLHFGIYRRGDGPVDPWWFVHQPRGSSPRLAVDTTRFGDWVRTIAQGTTLRGAPDPRAEGELVLPRHTAARVVAAVGSWYRVRLPDGGTGYLAARDAEPANRAIVAGGAPSSTELRTAPGRRNLAEAVLAVGLDPAGLDVLGRYGGYLLVRTAEGVAGWIEEE